jgi:hypothetical protein
MNRGISSVLALWCIALVGVALIFLSGFNFFGLINVQALNGPLPPDLAGLGYRAFMDAFAAGLLTLVAAIVLLKTRTKRPMIIGLAVLVVGLLLLYDGGNYWSRFDAEFNSINSYTPSFPLWAAVLIVECVLLGIAYLIPASRAMPPSTQPNSETLVDTQATHPTPIVSPDALGARSPIGATAPTMGLVRRIRIGLSTAILAMCAILNLVALSYLREAMSSVAGPVSDYTRANGNNIELQIMNFQYAAVGDSALVAGVFFALSAVAVGIGHRFRLGGAIFIATSLFAISADALANYTKPGLPVPEALAGLFWFFIVAALSSPLWKRGLWPLPNLLISLGAPLIACVVVLIGAGLSSHGLYERLQMAQSRPVACTAPSIIVSRAEYAYDIQASQSSDDAGLLQQCVRWANSTGDTATNDAWVKAQQDVARILTRSPECSERHLDDMLAHAVGQSALTKLTERVQACQKEALPTTDYHAKRLESILDKLADQTAASQAASEAAANPDYNIFVPNRNTKCESGPPIGDASAPDSFDSSIFAAAKIAEKRDPTPNSDDEGDALYVIFDPVHNIAAAKITSSPKSSQASEHFVIQRAFDTPPHVSMNADLSAVGMKSGIHLGSTATDVVHAYGRSSQYNSCSNTLTYAFSRWTKPHEGGDVGDPKSTVELTFSTLSPGVIRIDFWP